MVEPAARWTAQHRSLKLLPGSVLRLSSGRSPRGTLHPTVQCCSLRERERKQRFEAMRCCILGVRYAATQPSMYKSFGRCARAHSVLRYASRFTGSVLWFTNWIDVLVLASCLRPVLRKNPHAAEAVKLQHQQIPLIARSTEVGLNQGNRCGCALPGPGRVGEGWVRGAVR